MAFKTLTNVIPSSSSIKQIDRPTKMNEPLIPGAAPACSLRPLKRSATAPDLVSTDKGSLAASIITLLLSLPALLGTCCWPVLLAGLMGMTATASARALSHSLSLALMLAVLTNLAQFMAHKALGRKATLTTWQRYGPTFLLLAATPLLLADQIRHCLQDSGTWPEPASSMFRDDCESSGIFGGFYCLTPIGWLFAVFFTYTGFALMLVSVMWQTNFIAKVQMKLRGEEDCGC